MSDQNQDRRKVIRRQIEGIFASRPDDRRRVGYERRGVVRYAPRVTREMIIYGERRAYPNER